MERKGGLLLVFVVLALSAATTNATIVTIGLRGEVTYVDIRGGLFDGRINVGDPITGHYTYDSDTPDTDWNGGFVSETVGDYWHRTSPYGISVNIGGFIFQTDPYNVKFVIEIVNDEYYTEDAYNLRSYNNALIYEGVGVAHIHWQLNDFSGTALSSDDLPATPPVLEDYPDTWVGLTIEGGGPKGAFIIDSTVTSVWLIPEPSTLMFLALAGLLLRRKAK